MTDEKREITKKTAERIRYFRRLLGFSQEQLAFAAGMNPAFLGHIEQGLKCHGGHTAKDFQRPGDFHFPASGF